MRIRAWSSDVCSSDLIGQRRGRGDKGSEPFPARPGGAYPVQGRAIVLRSKQSTTDFGKGLQRVPNGRLFVGDPGVSQAFGGPIETAYDPIVGLHDDIGQG